MTKEELTRKKQEAGRKGGLARTDRTKMRGFGTNRDLAVKMGKLTRPYRRVGSGLRKTKNETEG